MGPSLWWRPAPGRNPNGREASTAGMHSRQGFGETRRCDGGGGAGERGGALFVGGDPVAERAQGGVRLAGEPDGRLPSTLVPCSSETAHLVRYQTPVPRPGGIGDCDGIVEHGPEPRRL